MDGQTFTIGNRTLTLVCEITYCYFVDSQGNECGEYMDLGVRTEAEWLELAQAAINATTGD